MEYNTSALRMRACHVAPYLSAALYAMNLIVVKEDQYEQIPTMAVDKYWRCYINPVFAEELGIEIAAHVLIHEVYHLICKHAERAQMKGVTWGDHHLWNIAADCTINQDLKSNGWTLPPDSWYPDKVEGAQQNDLTETIYDLLYDNAEKIEVPPFGEGSGVHGIKEDWEEGSGDSQSNNDEQQPVSEQRADVIRRMVAKEIVKSQGKVPNGLKRWADEHLNPKVDWRTKLAGAVRGQVSKAAGMVDFTYSRPNRRASCQGNFIFPKMVRPIPDVSLLVDTSGSMADTDLARGAAEAQGLLDSLGLPIRVYTADTRVHTAQSISHVSQIEYKGGGGTDMSRAIQSCAEDRAAALLVVVSDGYTGWPTKKPKEFDHIIAVITRDGQLDGIPKFIEAIQIDED